jgi:hypothetical protein
MGRALPTLDRGRSFATVFPIGEHGVAFKQRHFSLPTPYWFDSMGQCIQEALTEDQKAYHFGSGDEEYARIIGSTSFPDPIPLSEGVALPLDQAVARAHTTSGLSIAKWNALPQKQRDKHISSLVEGLKASLVPAKADTRPRRFVGTKDEAEPEAEAERETPTVEVKRPSGPKAPPEEDEAPLAAGMVSDEALAQWVKGEITLSVQDLKSTVKKRWGVGLRTATQIREYLISEHGYTKG